jgi:uncharacterized protein with von Willebrand factor type A (vWA) domain
MVKSATSKTPRHPHEAIARRRPAQAQLVEAEANQRTQELLAHFNLALAALVYARTVAELSDRHVAQLEAVRGSLADWRKTGECLRELSETQLHDLAVHMTSIQLADHAPMREMADLVLRTRHPGIAAASTLIAVLSRDVS